MLSKLDSLRRTSIYEGNLTETQKDELKFEIYLNGEKGNKLASYSDFIDFLDMYHIDPTSLEACMLEDGNPIDTPDGVARFKRVYEEKYDIYFDIGIDQMLQIISHLGTELRMLNNGLSNTATKELGDMLHNLFMSFSSVGKSQERHDPTFWVRCHLLPFICSMNDQGFIPNTCRMVENMIIKDKFDEVGNDE